MNYCKSGMSEETCLALQAYAHPNAFMARVAKNNKILAGIDEKDQLIEELQERINELEEDARYVEEDLRILDEIRRLV